MKIMFVDIAISGHRATYIRSLFESIEAERILVVPEKMDFSCSQYLIHSDSKNKKRSLFRYIKWMLKVRKIAKKEKPDIVHFLYADYFYKYFGFLLSIIPGRKILTLHSIRERKIEKLSLKRFSSKADKIVVHSAFAKQALNSLSINNVVHIEYPQFNRIVKTRDESAAYFNIDASIHTIVCLGSTRNNKGLDILLSALKTIDMPFQLLIAGQTTDFSEEYIDKQIESYRDKVKKCLHFLTDLEFAYALSVADFIVLPYRKSFNGASGPLGEGVSMNKCIIGPNHGILGFTINNNHLGYVFESENIDSLKQTLMIALQQAFVPDDVYIRYRSSLNVDFFKNKYNLLYNAVDRNA